MEAGDVGKTLDLILDDFYFKSPNQPAITNKEALRNALEGFHHSYSEQVEWEIEQIYHFGNTVVVRISEIVTMISKKNGASTTIEGIHFSLLTLQQDGNWKMKSDIGSLNHRPTWSRSK